MVEQATLQASLQSLLGPDGVLTGHDAARYAVDGLTPRVVARPHTVEEVAEVLRLAHQEGVAVVPWGGGTTMHLGNPLRRYDIALVLTNLDQVVEYEPADLTATLQAGMSLEAAQGHLAKSSQCLPLDPPRGDVATIGGILAANASGPSRHAYGTARDLTIGMRVVNADGRITRAGGRVVKNVAGYDLCKLYIGSLGSLGVIVEATFKLSPLPRVQRTVLVSTATPQEACTLASELHRRGLSLRAAELVNTAAAARAGLDAPGPYTLALWLAGTLAGVDRSLRQVRELATQATAAVADADHNERLWERIRRLAASDGVDLLCRASLLPSRIPELVAALATRDGASVLARPTIGVAYASWPSAPEAEAIVTDLRTVVANLGGSLVVEACPLDLKPRIDVFLDAAERSDFALTRGVKERFDPKGVLNPGRFLGRL